MKITAICCTYLRPRQLGNAIACFLKQTYDNKELVILDDTGQYHNVSLPYDNVRLVSTRHRFMTLGEKRNASAALGTGDAYCVWDDDDVYLPHHIEACADALTRGQLCVPERIYTVKNDKLVARTTDGLFHGSWAFTREAFERVSGYPFMQSGQDQGLFQRMARAKISRCSPQEFDPSYAYRWFSYKDAYHLSNLGKGGYEKLATRSVTVVNELNLTEERDWCSLISHS